MSICWCGNNHFKPFSPQYGVCKVCKTLVSLEPTSQDQLIAGDSENAFYGKDYWLTHQNLDLGLPDIHIRSRHDLTERNLHWLNALLKYRLPPADVIELGCSHGGFVAILQEAGYHSSGVEVSPWVVEYGKQTFQVPIHLGPVENLELPLESFDTVVLMDVLEHLQQPLLTLEHCTRLLRQDGFLVIQTPLFNENIDYQELADKQAPFLKMLIPDEHLFLFSKQSVERLLKQLGLQYIYYEPAIFSNYDMFLIAAKAPLQAHSTDQIESALLATPQGRLMLALLDLRDRELTLTKQLEESEHDRAARLEQIQTLTALLQETERDRTARLEQVQPLTTLLQETERDRTARLEQIQTLTALLQEAERDRAARLEQIQTLTALLQEAEQARKACLKQVQTLNAELTATPEQ
jgi:SAM-dependent methyltransferase